MRMSLPHPLCEGAERPLIPPYWDRLSVSLNPHAEEPLFAFVARLSLSLGHESIREFLHHSVETKFDERAVFNGAGQDMITNLTGLAPGVLSRTTPVRGPRRGWTINAENLPANALSFATLNFCPACLSADLDNAEGQDQEAGTCIRTWWMLDAVRACPKHLILLKPHCWNREKIASWAQSVIPFTRRPWVCEAVESEDEVALSTFVTSRLGFFEGPEEPPALRDLPLGTALKIVTELGRLIQLGPPGRCSDQVPGEWDLHTARRIGFAKIAGPEDKLPQALKSIADQLEPNDLWTPRQAFGGLADLAKRFSGDQRAKVFVQAVSTAASEHTRVVRTHELFNHSIKERASFLRSELAGELEISKGKLEDLMTLLGQIDQGRHAVPDTQLIIPATVVEKLWILSREAVDDREARLILGISSTELKALESSSLVRSYMGCKRRHYISRRLESLVRTLRGSAPVVSHALRGQVVLSKVSHIAPTLTFGRVCGALAAGRLKGAGILAAQQGLSGLLINRADLLEFAGKPDRFGDKLSGLTEIGRFFGVSGSEARCFVPHLMSDEVFYVTSARRRIPVIPTRSAMEFLDQNISFVEIMERCLYSQIRIRERLARAHVAQVISQPQSARSRFYSRREAEAVLHTC